MRQMAACAFVVLLAAVAVPVASADEKPANQKVGVTEGKARFSDRAPKYCPAPTGNWVQVVEVEGCDEAACKQAKEAAVKALTERASKTHGGCARWIEPFPHCMRSNCPKEEKKGKAGN